MSAPIIFVHYGNTYYLKYNLLLTKQHNPKKDIILLGDHNTLYLTKYGINHFFYNQFENKEIIQAFHRVFKPIVGPGFKKQRQFWLKFVFLQYFYIFLFCQKHQIKSFWKFDSDTIVVDDLSHYEETFSKFDISISSPFLFHGYIHNMRILEKYVLSMVNVFEDKLFIEKQKEDIHHHANYAFTEMRALHYFLNKEDVNCLFFDNHRNEFLINVCICSQSEQKTFSSYNKTYFPWFIKIKTLLKIFKKNKTIYLNNKNNNTFIKCISLNLSWLPPIIYSKLIIYLKEDTKDDPGTMRLFQFKFFLYHIFSVLYLHKIRRYFYLFKSKFYKP